MTIYEVSRCYDGYCDCEIGYSRNYDTNYFEKIEDAEKVLKEKNKSRKITDKDEHYEYEIYEKEFNTFKNLKEYRKSEKNRIKKEKEEKLADKKKYSYKNLYKIIKKSFDNAKVTNKQIEFGYQENDYHIIKFSYKHFELIMFNKSIETNKIHYKDIRELFGVVYNIITIENERMEFNNKGK